MTGRHTAITLAVILGVLAGLGLRASAREPVVAAAPQLPPSATDPAAVEFFETRVRPVLVAHCHKCHSAAADPLKAGLRLDSRVALLRGGDSGPAVVPGDPAASRLIAAITYDDPDLQMPPKTRLSAQQIADLTTWIQQGAAWPDQGTAGAVELTSTATFDLWTRRDAHWAWRPVNAQPPPDVTDAAWPRTPVDRFILAALERHSLKPAAPADRHALLRRVYFTLTGLPPSPEELDAFLADPVDDALETVVDRLLASPRYGERWARHWLDVVRYSDTLGNETDLPIHNAWRYRDYVIRAFNADVPYDQFVLEHLAGDLLPEPRRHPTDGFNESLIGTGFFWLGEGRRSPVDLRITQADTFDNQIDVTCKTFMAMTVSCARCHDHKFDAIPTSDYYALYGYLKSSRYTQAQVNRAVLDAGAAELTSLRSKVRAAASAALRQRAGPLSRYLAAAAEVGAANRPAAEVASSAGLNPALLERWVAALKEPTDVTHGLFAWQRLAALGPAAPPESIEARWQELIAEAKAFAANAATAHAPRPGDVELANWAADGFKNWLPEDQSFGPAPLRPGDFLLGPGPVRPVATFVRGGPWAHSVVLSPTLEGTLRSASFTIDRRFLHVLAAGQAARVNVVIDHFVMIQNPLYGTLRRELNGGVQWHTFDLDMWKGRRAYIEFADTTTPDLHAMGAPVGVGPDGHAAVARVVLSGEQAPPPSPAPATPIALLGEAPVDSLAALAERYQRVVNESLDAFAAGELDASPDGEARAMLLAWIVEHGLLDADVAPTAAPPGAPDGGGDLESLFQRYRQVEAQLPAPQRVPAMADGTPDEEHVFIRGSPKTLAPAPEPRRMLQAIAGPVAQQPPAPATGSGRLELARRVADPANPLTARVIVNRVWHHVFGRGIVPSVDNFGALGEAPSHPELLDYLADRFAREGWSVKRLVRELVLSSTFRMSSTAADPAAAELADPDNRLMHRMPVRRLEAEAIRDQILAVSGRLEPDRMYGPGVEIFLTPYMDNYGDDYGRPKASGPLDGDGRRSLYIMVRRNFLTPMLVAFDSPPPLNTQGRRSVSNVPAQALILMNDPFVAEQSRRWAARVLAPPDLDAAARVRHMYLQAFARPPSADELAIALRFLERQGGELGIPEAGRANDPRVWADFAHVMMNVKEFIFLN
jgi:mono/diheme cytochrome c family protein